MYIAQDTIMDKLTQAKKSAISVNQWWNITECEFEVFAGFLFFIIFLFFTSTHFFSLHQHQDYLDPGGVMLQGNEVAPEQ